MSIFEATAIRTTTTTITALITSRLLPTRVLNLSTPRRYRIPQRLGRQKRDMTTGLHNTTQRVAPNGHSATRAVPANRTLHHDDSRFSARLVGCRTAVGREEDIGPGSDNRGRQTGALHRSG